MTAVIRPDSRLRRMPSGEMARRMRASIPRGSRSPPRRTSPGPAGARFRPTRPADHAEKFAAARLGDLVEAKAGPGALEELAATHRLVGVSRERASIDGTHRGAAENVERHRAPDVLGHLGEDVHHDAHLVGSSCCSSGQNERYQPAVHRGHVNRSPVGGPVLATTRGIGRVDCTRTPASIPLP